MFKKKNLLKSTTNCTQVLKYAKDNTETPEQYYKIKNQMEL